MDTGGLVAIGILFALFALVLVRFARWRRSAYERVKTGSSLARTSRGTIEYAMSGEGPPVVVLHGGLGGFDQGRMMGEDLRIPDSFTMIAPSRAGYLRTPLSTCRTPAETADAIAELLDELGLGAAGVVGISGGGPTALQMAIRHPARVRALVMIVAISRRHTQPRRTTHGIGRLLFMRSAMWLVDLACWLLFVQTARYWPARAARWCFKGSETLDSAAISRRVEQFRKDPAQVEWLRMLIAYLFPISLRKVGLANDLEQFAAIDEYPVGRIACPTLVVHGRHDGNIPFEHAEFVAAGVPGAELFVVEGCGHLVWLSEHAGAVRAKVADFLKRHMLWRETPARVEPG